MEVKGIFFSADQSRSPCCPSAPHVTLDQNDHCLLNLFRNSILYSVSAAKKHEESSCNLHSETVIECCNAADLLQNPSLKAEEAAMWLSGRTHCYYMLTRFYDES